MRTVILLAVFIGLATSLYGGRPDIVLILADDLGYGDLSSYEAADIRTPHIDRIGAEGVTFRQFYANAPECTPTRTALLTGRYQQRVGGLECAIGNGNNGRYDDAIRLRAERQLGLPVEDAEIPRGLKEAGYAAAIIGKWHLGYEKHFNPMEHGWDEFFGPLGGGVDYFHHTEPLGEFLGDELPGEEMLYHGRERVEREGYLTEMISGEAVRWLESLPDGQPYFLYVPYTCPHTPLQGPEDWREEKMTSADWNDGTRETYVEMIEAMDDGIGKILAAVESRGGADNTVVIFFSDNGPTKRGGTGGLRGNKGNVFEGGIRVPCMVRYPGRIRAGLVNEEPFIGMDLTASILRLAGAEPGRPLDGVDILQAVEGEGAKPVERPLFWRKRRGEKTVKAMREGDWKLVVQQDGEKSETYLFNLGEDPAEEVDLAEKAAGRMRAMSEGLAEWEEEVAPGR